MYHWTSILKQYPQPRHFYEKCMYHKVIILKLIPTFHSFLLKMYVL